MPWNEKKKYKGPKGVQSPRRGLENPLPVLQKACYLWQALHCLRCSVAGRHHKQCRSQLSTRQGGPASRIQTLNAAPESNWFGVRYNGTPPPAISQLAIVYLAGVWIYYPNCSSIPYGLAAVILCGLE